jgi:rhamnosyltransferase
MNNKLKDIKICTILISYNDPISLIKSVDLLNGNSDDIVIVDNNSDVETKNYLKQLKGVIFISLDDNVGVAKALNVGVKHAEKLGYQWFLLLDQDSRPDNYLIKELKNAIALGGDTKFFACNINGNLTSTDFSNYVITSGSLIHYSVFENVGFFKEKLFIDCIDIEFCIRFTKLKKIIQVVLNGKIYHSIGLKKRGNFFLSRFYTHHHPQRYYYMYRNFLYLFSIYILKYPFFSLKILIVQFFHFLAMLINGPDRISCSTYAAKGVLDFIRNRYGKY